MKNKKAVSLSLQTVVVALILIVVMAVVLIIFGKGIGDENEIIKKGIDDVADCFPGSDTYTPEKCEEQYIKTTCPNGKDANGDCI